METEVESSTLATRVKELRRLLGKSAEAFADETGIGLGALRHIEQGRTLNPGIFIIEQICTTYGVSEKWLIRNMGPIFDEPTKVEGLVDQLQLELKQTRQERDQWQVEAAYQEEINRGLRKLGSAKPVVKQVRPGKHEGVSTGSSERVRIGRNLPILTTLRATSYAMS